MSQRFSESSERVTPYHLCRLREPLFSHIPKAGSKEPPFEWPSVQKMLYHSHSHSRKPSASKSTKFPEDATCVPTPVVARPLPKGRTRKVFKCRSGSSQARSSSSASAPSLLSRITPSSLDHPSGQTQIHVSDPVAPRMIILEIVARDAAILSKFPDQHLEHGLVQAADSPAPAVHGGPLFSHRFSCLLNPAPRDDGEPQTPASQRGLRQSVDELSSTAHSQSSSVCMKRKRKRQDSDIPTAPVRVSKRTRVPTERAQPQVVPPAGPAKNRSRRKASDRITLSEPKTAETSPLRSSSPSVCSVSATQPRRSGRRRTAMGHGGAETLPSSLNVDASAGTRKRRKPRLIQ